MAANMKDDEIIEKRVRFHLIEQNINTLTKKFFSMSELKNVSEIDDCHDQIIAKLDESLIQSMKMQTAYDVKKVEIKNLNDSSKSVMEKLEKNKKEVDMKTNDLFKLKEIQKKWLQMNPESVIETIKSQDAILINLKNKKDLLLIEVESLQKEVREKQMKLSKRHKSYDSFQVAVKELHDD